MEYVTQGVQKHPEPLTPSTIVTDTPEYLYSTEATARQRDQDIVYSNDHTLQIDIDSDEDFAIWTEIHPRLLRHLPVKQITITYSRSGPPHRHITVTCASYVGLGQWQRIALQAILGSHRKREMFNAIRTMNGETNKAICFYEDREEPQ